MPCPVSNSSQKPGSRRRRTTCPRVGRRARAWSSSTRTACGGTASKWPCWAVAAVPSLRDLWRRVARGEAFDAVLIGGGAIAAEEVARLTAAVPQLPIVAAADGEDDRHAERLLSAGVRDVLPANTGLQRLIATLARICGAPSPPPSRGPAAKFSARVLTRRQREVLTLISEGKSNRLIAAALSLSEETVKAHVKQIIRRLKVANRTQAALIATGASRGPAIPLAGPPQQG